MTLKVIYGPPCSGKSTYVTDNLTDNDIRFDYDSIIQAISNKISHEYSDIHLPYVVEYRGMIISKSSKDSDMENVYIIATRITDKLQEELSGIDAEYVLMDTTKEECYAYLEDDSSREDKEAWKQKIDDWFDWHEEFSGEGGESELPKNKVGKQFWNFVKNQATSTQPESIELRIEGDIVDDGDVWMYEWFGEPAAAPNSFRNELNVHKDKDLTVWISSYGGSVFAGASIYNALKEHKGKVTVKIDDKAMSAASVIAMAGDEILMSPTAILMIHNPMTGGFGDMHDLRKVADVLDTVKESIVNAYVLKTGKSKDEISSMMDSETWMSANVAVEKGFANSVLYQDDAESTASVQNFSFNRLAIVNGANDSIKNAYELFNKPKIEEPSVIEVPDNEAENEKILMELDLI